MSLTINGEQHYVYQASSKIQQGDHIGVLMTSIEFPQYDGPIHHHGIVSHVAANHEIKIIHKVPKDSKNLRTIKPVPATIEEIPLHFFLNDANCFTIFEHENYDFAKREMAINRAKEHMKKHENEINGDFYDTVLGNCDSFILSCITGRDVLNLPMKFNLINSINTIESTTRVLKHFKL